MVAAADRLAHISAMVRRAPPSQSVPDALLRLWMAADIAMAGLYGWEAWLMRDWPDDVQLLRTQGVALTEFMYVFLFVPAAVVVGHSWWRTRDRLLAVLVLLYGLARAATLVPWPGADMASVARPLFMAHAIIALGGVPVAMRALWLRAGQRAGGPAGA